MQVYKNTFAFLAGALMFSGVISASVPAPTGDPVMAKMDAHFVIVLPANQPLADGYYIDISSVAFPDAMTLTEFCRHATDRFVSFQANFEEKRIYFAVHPGAEQASWGVAEWNSYLAQRAPKFEVYYNTAPDTK